MDDDRTSIRDLAAAVKEGKIAQLAPEDTVGRVYSAEQIRTIAEHLGSSSQEAVRSIHGLKGKNSAYAKAAALVRSSKGDRAALERAILKADHKQVFSFVSYHGIPPAWDKDATGLWHWLANKHGWNGTVHPLVALPLSKPGSLLPRLESASIDGPRITFVCSVLRIVRRPEADTEADDDLMVVRIPILVSLLFDLGVIEISMPKFAEPPLPYHSSKLPQALPGRMFAAAETTVNMLVSEQFIPGPPGQLPPNNLMILLETERKGEDLGWDAERLKGMKGKFNTIQRGRVALKAILTEFSEELRSKCSSLGVPNPIGDTDLYAIFRALKSSSHTISMDMGVNLGKRNGRIEISAYYGQDGEGHDPIYWVMNGFNVDSREALRQAVREASLKKDLEDPYAIGKVLQQQAT